VREEQVDRNTDQGVLGDPLGLGRPAAHQRLRERGEGGVLVGADPRVLPRQPGEFRQAPIFDGSFGVHTGAGIAEHAGEIDLGHGHHRPFNAGGNWPVISWATRVISPIAPAVRWLSRSVVTSCPSRGASAWALYWRK
jgi:hypothetical protein